MFFTPQPFEFTQSMSSSQPPNSHESIIKQKQQLFSQLSRSLHGQPESKQWQLLLEQTEQVE